MPKYGFTFDMGGGYPDLPSHVLYPISHANIWHLAANLLCLWMIPCRTHIIVTYIIAVICSFLPSFCLYDSLMSGGFMPLQQPTYGFSGILFAMVGISWGKIRRFKRMIWKNKWFLIIPAFLPHINFLIHIYCLLAGYLYGTLYSMTNEDKPCDKKSANS